MIWPGCAKEDPISFLETMDSAQFLTGFKAADSQRSALAKLPVEPGCGRKEMGQQFGIAQQVPADVTATCRAYATGDRALQAARPTIARVAGGVSRDNRCF